jgi:hypothetical protein
MALNFNNMQPKESKSNKHFYTSLLKSGVRIFAGIVLATGGLGLAGILLVIAEILGVVEEL